MRRRNTTPPTYRPAEGAPRVEVLRAAYLCGRDLSPRDRRANWIDALTGDDYRDAVEAYHAGQSAEWSGDDRAVEDLIRL